MTYHNEPLIVEKSTSLKHCPECNETIRVDTEIVKSPKGKWIHHTCDKEPGYNKNKRIELTDFWNLDD